MTRIRGGCRMVFLLWIAVCAILPGAARAEGEKVAAVSRAAIDDRYKWNVAALFASDEEWEARFGRLEEAIGALEKYRGTLSRSPSALLEWFAARDSVARRYDMLSVYASLRADEDTRVALYQDMDARASRLGTLLKEKTSWADPEIAAIDADTLRAFIARKKGLETYRFHIEDGIRRRAHVLSPREEELLAMSGTALAAPAKIAGMLRNADMEFPDVIDEEGREVTLTPGRFESFRASADARLRRDAYIGMLGAYEGKANTLAAALSGTVEAHIFHARARGFDSSLEASLFRNNIPPEVYSSLIDAVSKNIEPVHRYVALRKKALGLNEIHYCDLYPSLAENPPGAVSWDEAVEKVLECVRPLGAEYAGALREGLRSGWVDVYENEGKRSGAYSNGAHGSMPYILLNFGDNIDGVFTLAHETGHSMHSLLTGRRQAYVNSDYSTFVAEVASTANEALLQHRLEEDAAGGETDARIYILDRFLKDMMGTVIRQTMFADFELTMHEMAERGESLTPDALCTVYAALVRKYYGPEMVIDPETAYTWARIPHFFYNFYVFQYATSYAASYAIAEKILAGEPGAVEKYLGLLAEGGGDYPIEELKRAGVDMTTPAPVEAVMRAFAGAVNRLEKLIDAS